MSLLAALVTVVAAGAAPAGPEWSAPCAACVTWRATPATARRLLAEPGRLEGLDLLLDLRGPAGGDGPRDGADVARDLAARGARVGLEMPLDGGPSAVLPPGVSRVVLELPPDGAMDDALVFAIRTRATALRAASPRLAIGLAGRADVPALTAARGLGPYVSFRLDDRPLSDPTAAGALEVWETGGHADSVAAVLRRTVARTGSRLLLDADEADVPVVRALARLADVLPEGLAALPAVEVSVGEDGAEVPVFLHPGSLEAVALVDGGGALSVRPRVDAAWARPLATGAERPLPVTPGHDRTGVDARTVDGPAVLRLSGWAGETAFRAGVEVSATRALTVEEIVAAHQAAAARQAARVRALVATGTTVLSFQVPGLAAPMVVSADTVLFRRGTSTEIEQRDLRLNGVPVAVGEDGVPRLPLVQPERVVSAPLSITLGEAYRYRLLGEDTAAGRPCYLVGFEPVGGRGPALRGRAWIGKDGFPLVRLVTTQTGLKGPIVSSRQEDEFAPLDVEGETEWLLARSETEQVYEGPGQRTPVHRRIALERQEANPPDFDARLSAAYASKAVLLRETAEGFVYLRRASPGPAATAGATPEATPDATPTAAASARATAGRATRVWTVAAGTLFDPGIDRPLPFAGLGYLDFDLLGTGAQLNAFLAGPFAQVALSVPSVGGPGTQVQAWGFASLVPYNDRSFRGGLERYDENLRQRPLRASVALLRRTGARTRVRAAYDFEAVHLEANDTTAAGFVVPVSPVAHALRLGLEWERGAWSATAWGSAAARQEWRPWGRAGDYDPHDRTYERAGLTVSRSFAFSPTAVGRLEASGLAGRHLDRFSRFGFDAFDNRLRGYPSAGVRFDRGAVLRSAAVWSARKGLRLDGFVDAALVHDPMEGPASRGQLGMGAALEVALPGRVLLDVDWGYGFQARGRDGRPGTQVVRITAYRIL